MIKHIKTILRNKNLWCFTFLSYLIYTHHNIIKSNLAIVNNMANEYSYTYTLQQKLYMVAEIKYILVFFVIILIICIIYPGNFAAMKSSTKITKTNKLLLIPVIIIYLLYMFYVVGYNINIKTEYLKNFGTYDKIIDISLNSLENSLEFETALIYIEREGCPDCISTSRIISYLSKDYGVSIYKYNTIHDREKNSKKLDEILTLYNVELVPSVIIIQDGKHIKTLSGGDIEKELTSFLIEMSKYS